MPTAATSVRCGALVIDRWSACDGRPAALERLPRGDDRSRWRRARGELEGVVRQAQDKSVARAIPPRRRFPAARGSAHAGGQWRRFRGRGSVGGRSAGSTSTSGSGGGGHRLVRQHPYPPLPACWPWTSCGTAPTTRGSNRSPRFRGRCSPSRSWTSTRSTMWWPPAPRAQGGCHRAGAVPRADRRARGCH